MHLGAAYLFLEASIHRFNSLAGYVEQVSGQKHVFLASNGESLICKLDSL